MNCRRDCRHRDEQPLPPIADGQDWEDAFGSPNCDPVVHKAIAEFLACWTYQELDRDGKKGESGMRRGRNKRESRQDWTGKNTVVAKGRRTGDSSKQAVSEARYGRLGGRAAFVWLPLCAGGGAGRETCLLIGK